MPAEGWTGLRWVGTLYTSRPSVGGRIKRPAQGMGARLGDLQPVSTVRPKAETLDLLRAVAALSVVVLHIAPLAEKLGVTIPGSRLGSTGVQLFFVLSGYLITNAVLSRSYSRRTYIVNRSFRILPAYFFCLFIIVFFRDTSPLMTRNGLRDVAAHVTFVHGFFKDYRTSINPVLWTLSIEMLYYLFMLACARGMRHRLASWCIVAAMFVGALVYRTWMWKAYDQPGQLNFLYKQLPGMMDQFAFGMAAALLMKQQPFREFVARGAVKITGLVLGLAGLTASLVLYNRHATNLPVIGYWHEWYMVILWPLTFCGSAALLMVSLLQFERRLAPWIRRSGLGFVGVCSYSLYLFHPLVIQSFSRAWRPQHATVSPKLYLAFAVLGVLIAAAMSYLLVERPFMQLRSRFNAPRPEPPDDLPTPTSQTIRISSEELVATTR
jgi:peptidoglycan/LPS O-acetylase OafA/YrhL